MEHIKAIIARLDERDCQQPLSPRQAWDRELEEQIEALRRSAGQKNTSMTMLLAALHVRNDNIDMAHSYAQQVDHEATGAYWHGIIHRMEGDYPNAKYWFMRVGAHPVMDRVRQQVKDWLSSAGDVTEAIPSYLQGKLAEYMQGAGWEPHSFVDLVAWQESASGNGTDRSRHILQHIQHIEVKELFDYTLSK